MLSRIKKSLRITHEYLDDEIQSNIDACLLDLQRVGVSAYTQNNLTDKAVEIYCKWQFDFQGKGEQFRKNYEKLRDGLSMAEGYKEGAYDD